MVKGWMLWAGFAGSISCTAAQSVEITYTTELQGNDEKVFNWVNLLRVGGILPVKSSRFEFASIHIYKSNSRHLAGDWQAYSNIEEENRWGNIAVLGYTHVMRNMSLFLGVRNVNEDYFISPATSLFTNSSCGIFPTISGNYPVANYPLSAMCLDYKWNAGEWNFESSLYNGVAYEGFQKKRNILTVCPSRDGVFSISSLNYHSDVGNYFGGVALHNRVYHCDEEGKQILEPQREEEEISKKINVAWWVYLEQPVYKQGLERINLLAQYSENRSIIGGCKRYVGLGMIASNLLWKHKQNEIGLFMNCADFTYGKEIACEATWKIRLANNWTLQPTFHWIRNSKGTYGIGLIRMVGVILNK